MSEVSTHVLDTSRGVPAAGVAVRLERQGSAGSWQDFGTDITGADGRARGFPAPLAGTYRLTFDTSGYFEDHGIVTFFPVVVVCFRVSASRQRYHVPLLVSPWGYTTYRGS
jgi:5-hydroxyisourate hydrolase